MFNLEKNNSPKRCSNLCNIQRFKYAAVKGYSHYLFALYKLS